MTQYPYIESGFVGDRPGVLIVLVGFSAGMETGFWAIGVYLAVQIIDGYIIVPYVARKTVDLAPGAGAGAHSFCSEPCSASWAWPSPIRSSR
jgi:hypothetical protein